MIEEEGGKLALEFAAQGPTSHRSVAQASLQFDEKRYCPFLEQRPRLAGAEKVQLRCDPKFRYRLDRVRLLFVMKAPQVAITYLVSRREMMAAIDSFSSSVLWCEVEAVPILERILGISKWLETAFTSERSEASRSAMVQKHSSAHTESASNMMEYA